MATKRKRIKAKAIVDAPQSRENVIADIAQIGICQRERQRIEATMNDELAKVREEFETQALALAADITRLSAGVQAWCEANRYEITQNNKTKTVSFQTGEVKWRTRPPSVSVRGAEAVIEALKNLKLDQFIRTKDEINKEAILADQVAASGVRGIKINKDLEDFVIEPFETKLEQAA